MPNFPTLPSLAKIGLGAAAVISTVAVAFGTISHSDVYRMDRTVSAQAFTDPKPGELIEVVDGMASAICQYEHVDQGVKRGQPRHLRYYNALGQNIPVASLIAALLPDADFELQVEIYRNSYIEGLVATFNGQPNDECEAKAQMAYARNSVVCVVDAVVRAPVTNEILAVRFKPFAFTPEGVTHYARCPMHLPTDVFWEIRETFISVSSIAKGPLSASSNERAT